MLFEVDKNIIVVNNAVHGSCHNEGCQHIEYGMLFDEYGSQNYGNTGYRRKRAPCFCLPGNGDRAMGSKGIINMDARPEVGWRVGSVKGCNHLGKNVVPGHDDGP